MLVEKIAMNRIMKRIDKAVFVIQYPNGIHANLFIPANHLDINLERNGPDLERNKGDLVRNTPVLVRNSDNVPQNDGQNAENLEQNVGTKLVSLQDSKRNASLFRRYSNAIIVFCRTNSLLGVKAYGKGVTRGARTFTIPIIVKPSQLDKFKGSKACEFMALSAGSKMVTTRRHNNLMLIEFELDEDDYTEYIASDTSGNSIGYSTIKKSIPYDIKNASMPQTVVYGGSGAGKTVTIYNLMLATMRVMDPSEVKFIIPDYDGEFQFMIDSEYMACQVSKPNDIYSIMNVLQFGVDDLEKRASMPKSDVKKMPIVVVVADEVVHILSENPNEAEQITIMLTKLVNGRKNGYRVIYGAHEVTKNDVPGKNRIGIRIIGNVDTRQASDATGMKDSKAQHLSGKGDMFLSVAGVLTRFQTARVTEEDFDFMTKCDVKHAPVVYYQNDGEWNDGIDASETSESKTKAGRKPNHLSYKNVAKYIIAANSNVSASDMAKEIGHSKRQKDAHNKAAKEINLVITSDGYEIVKVEGE